MGYLLPILSYKVGSLLYVLFFLRDTRLHQILIQVDVAAAFVVMVFWYYILFVKHSDVHAQVFRMTLTGNIGEDTKR